MVGDSAIAGPFEFWFGGLLDTPSGTSQLTPLAFFSHAEVVSVQRQMFGVTRRSRALTQEIEALKERLRDDIYRFIADRVGETRGWTADG